MLDDVVDEVIYVTDMDAAFAVAGKVRKAAYETDEPACASTIAAITRPAFPPVPTPWRWLSRHDWRRKWLPRMHTATVRSFERDGMLTRHVYAEVPPRVEYELTPFGRELTEPVLGLISWLQSNWPAIRCARDRFDARSKATRTVARPVASATIRA